MLCDEPTGSLDLDTGRQVLGVLRDLAREGHHTVLLVTHNSAIARMADRVVRLHSGAIASDERVGASGRGRGARVVSRVLLAQAAPGRVAPAHSVRRGRGRGRDRHRGVRRRERRVPQPEGLVRDRVRHPTASRRCAQRSERRRDRERRGTPARRTRSSPPRAQQDLGARIADHTLLSRIVSIPDRGQPDVAQGRAAARTAAARR